MTHTHEEHHRLLKKTINFLTAEGYELTADDDAFLELVKTDLRGFQAC